MEEKRCFYISVDPETDTHQTEFDLLSFPFIGKPIYYSEYCKKLHFDEEKCENLSIVAEKCDNE